MQYKKIRVTLKAKIFPTKNLDKIPRPEAALGGTSEPAPVPTVCATPKPTKEQT